MPSARTEVTAATLNSRISVVGGLDADGNSLATVEVFDPEREAWSDAAPLPEGRDHQRLAVLRGRAVLSGRIQPLPRPASRRVGVRRTHRPVERSCVPPATARRTRHGCRGWAHLGLRRCRCRRRHHAVLRPSCRPRPHRSGVNRTDSSP
ncbi:kelch repeat-containing protein [Curtobacterium sp. 9128]|uniref:Kelch repeat-containing protein n=1 Tax=Curtobacterium sp. 9128 TaxID=1793722 RepID=UPI0011A9CD91